MSVKREIWRAIHRSRGGGLVPERIGWFLLAAFVIWVAVESFP